MGIEEAIRESYLMQGLSEEELQNLYEIASRREYSDGDVILKQFDSTQDLFILESGQAHVLTVVGEPIGVVKPGMPMGEVSFLDGRPRSVSVISCGRSEAVFLPADKLLSILALQPRIANIFLWNVSRVLCMRLRSANNNIAALLAIDESEYTAHSS